MTIKRFFLLFLLIIQYCFVDKKIAKKSYYSFKLHIIFMCRMRGSVVDESFRGLVGSGRSFGDVVIDFSSSVGLLLLCLCPLAKISDHINVK